LLVVFTVRSLRSDDPTSAVLMRISFGPDDAPRLRRMKFQVRESAKDIQVGREIPRCWDWLERWGRPLPRRPGGGPQGAIGGPRSRAPVGPSLASASRPTPPTGGRQTHTRTHAHTHPRTHAPTHTHTHTHTFARTHTPTHTHARTHTHPALSPPPNQSPLTFTQPTRLLHPHAPPCPSMRTCTRMPPMLAYICGCRSCFGPADISVFFFLNGIFNALHEPILLFFLYVSPPSHAVYLIVFFQSRFVQSSVIMSPTFVNRPVP